jgi:hypothetical protein
VVDVGVPTVGTLGLGDSDVVSCAGPLVVVVGVPMVVVVVLPGFGAPEKVVEVSVGVTTVATAALMPELAHAWMVEKLGATV